MTLEAKLLAHPLLKSDALAPRLLPLLLRPTGLSSAGHPYLERRTFERFRDTIPLLFGAGEALLRTQAALLKAADDLHLDAPTLENLHRATRVARQMALTAAIAAPTDLWLLRHILGTHKALGLLDRLLDGQAIHPEFTTPDGPTDSPLLNAEQLSIDLEFLLSRGLVEEYDESYRIAGHHRVRHLFTAISPIPPEDPVPATPLWRALLTNQTSPDLELLLHLQTTLDAALVGPHPEPTAHNHWIPRLSDVLIGYLLVPVVLGLRAAGKTRNLSFDTPLTPDTLAPQHPALSGLAIKILTAAGWLTDQKVTLLGARGFARGPGPFGIIQTYVPYMARAEEILRQGRQKVWVRRGENIGASQDANRKTFQRANDHLDRFCEDTGFRYNLFIEHAIGRGEATRQRFERSGEDAIRYFGADLEDSAIDAAIEEQQQGRLPANMIFVRNADIGKPQILIDAIKAKALDPYGAVMLVGNGFHEVRGQTDAMMIDVFKGYHDAGILLLFTEENALSIDDLRATAWNTYHAGFKYVHEKSGQCLRPASPRPKPRLGPPQRAAWSECAFAAGYQRIDNYCGRTRTIYPYARHNRPNPSISVNHFFVPTPILASLS